MQGKEIEILAGKRQLARVSLVTQAGGHYLHLENPEPCAAAILEFLAQVEQQQAPLGQGT